MAKRIRLRPTSLRATPPTFAASEGAESKVHASQKSVYRWVRVNHIEKFSIDQNRSSGEVRNVAEAYFPHQRRVLLQAASLPVSGLQSTKLATRLTYVQLRHAFTSQIF